MIDATDFSIENIISWHLLSSLQRFIQNNQREHIHLLSAILNLLPTAPESYYLCAVGFIYYIVHTCIE